MTLHDRIGRLRAELAVRRRQHAWWGFRRAHFGAASHRYRSEPVATAAIDALERRLGVALPIEYRQWLVDVGTGAGPYYGLDGFAAVDVDVPVEDEGPDVSPLTLDRVELGAVDVEDTLDPMVDLEDPPGREGRVPDVSALTLELVARCVNEAGRDTTMPWRASCEPWITANSLAGALRIGTQGCNFDTYLVVAGELRGRVLVECCDMISPPGPAAAFFPDRPDQRGPDGTPREPASWEPLAFLDWMEVWLWQGTPPPCRPGGPPRPVSRGLSTE